MRNIVGLGVIFLSGALLSAPGAESAQRRSVQQPAVAEYREELRIGRIEGLGPDVFGRVAAIEVDRLGRIYVLDEKNFRVAVFGPEGQSIRTMGRKGQGPGEFERPMGLAWLSPTEIVVVDLGRYVVFDTAGQYVRNVRRPTTFIQNPYGGSAAAGALCDLSVTPDSLSLLVTGSDGAVSKFSLPSPPPATVLSPTGRRIRPPFAPSTAYQTDCVARGVWKFDSANSHIYLIGFKADTLRRIAHGFPAKAIPDAARAAEIERVARSSGVTTAALDKITPRSARYFVDAFVASSGEVWIAPAPASPTTPGMLYSVIARDGRVLMARLSRPLHPIVRPIVRETAVYGVVSDINDVDYVVRLRRPTS